MDVETRSSQTVKKGDMQLAVFKVKGRYYASQQMCPHRRAFALSDGLVGEVGEAGPDCKDSKLYVSCLVHMRNFQLNGDIEDAIDKSRESCSTDTSVSVATFEAEERDNEWVYLKLPPVGELDAVLGTRRWVVKEESNNPFENVDKKLGLNKGWRKGIKMGSMTAGTNRMVGVTAEKRIGW